jgi:transposase-like protein
MSKAWSAKLREAKRERDKALTLARSYEKQIAREASRARDGGVPVHEIGAVLGVSRQSVYNMIDRVKRGEKGKA